MLDFGLRDTAPLVVAICIFIFAALWVIIGIPIRWKKRLRNTTPTQESYKLSARYFVEQGFFVILCAFSAVVALFLIINRASVWYGTWNDIFNKTDSTPTIRVVTGNSILPHADTSDSPAPKTPPSETPSSSFMDPGSNVITLAKGVASASYVLDSVPIDFSELQKDPLNNPAFAKYQKEKRGVWIRAKIDGQGEEGDGRTLIYLPASYLTETNKAYPVLIALHGIPGSILEYRDALDVDHYYGKTVRNGTNAEAIIVVPEPFPQNLDTECMDVPGVAMETWLTSILPAWLNQNLRTIHDRNYWAVEGYSAGGWCSAMLAIRHPDLFGAGIIKAGYFAPLYEEGDEWNNPDDPRYQLSEVVKNKPAVKLFVVTGEQDELFRDSYEEFRQNVQSPTELTEYEISGSTHRWEIYRQSSIPAYEWLGRNLKGFAAQS
ncbi:enterochelin esterase-like enzyme [Arcanobacterium pluranimalium]|uniref:alpha/beta hydrolase n=1 Tax=Arcanobacterium pluranimalium TaxID=108028 RepID=UPI00195725E2|nr:alpha/beta hydrolase-fold protein [Arcanobacterium pluranimalium]MBM7824564.1 enterochelin esterase-like enzyme [Arcanobacterium pluranimalium]